MLPKPQPPENRIRDRLIETAQELAQTVGVNAFSYRDLATRVGIRSATVHYYFPKKEDLTRALIEKYRADFSHYRDLIQQETEAPAEQLMRYVQLCTGAMEEGLRVCLCGMLATDYLTLGTSTQAELRGFIAENEEWLEQVLRKGKQVQKIKFKGTPKQAAKAVFGLIEGMIIISHCFDDQKDRLLDSKNWLSSIGLTV